MAVVALEGRFLNAAAKTTLVIGPTNELGVAVKMQDGAVVEGAGEGLGEGVGVCAVAVGVGVLVAVGVGVSEAAVLGVTLATNGVGEAGHCFSWTHPAKTIVKATKAKTTAKRFNSIT